MNEKEWQQLKEKEDLEEFNLLDPDVGLGWFIDYYDPVDYLLRNGRPKLGYFFKIKHIWKTSVEVDGVAKDLTSMVLAEKIPWKTIKKLIQKRKDALQKIVNQLVENNIH